MQVSKVLTFLMQWDKTLRKSSMWVKSKIQRGRAFKGRDKLRSFSSKTQQL